MTTIQIKYSDIPAYLHTGDFYRSLDSEDPEGIIEVPADCFHQDGLEADDIEEFRQLLRVMVFWVLDEIPLGVMDFCRYNHVDVWGKGVGDLPEAPKQEVQPLLLTAFSKSNEIPFHNIVETGRWDLIMHAVSRIAKSSPATAAAAQCGNLRLLQYLHEEGFEWHEETCHQASFGGHLDCLRYAHENGCQWNSSVYTAAAHNGHLHCMHYAFNQGLEWHTDVCKEAALKGNLDCLQFAHKNGCPWNSETTECAAQGGHVHCLVFAVENGCPVEVHACNFACRNGHVDCLQMLHQLVAPWDASTSTCSAHYNTTDCLHYLHEHGCPWDEDTPLQAAHDGHIEPLRYALEHGCPYNDEIVLRSVHSINFSCLRYTVEDQLLKMDEEAFSVALLRGDLACLQYLVDQGCPYMNAEFYDYVEYWEICDKIFRKDNPEFVLCVEYAVERGWVPCSNFIQYIVTRDEPCKQWLISESYYWEGGAGAGAGGDGNNV